MTLIESDPQHSHIQIIKGVGNRQLLLISSNAYEDREREIVTRKALDEYVRSAYTGDQYTADNALLFWHGGDPVGTIKEAALVGNFLVELAEELPDAQVNLARYEKETPMLTTIKRFWDALERSTDNLGASIGFKAIKGDEQDGAFDHILKFETSILPLEFAANSYTLAQVLGRITNA